MKTRRSQKTPAKPAEAPASEPPIEVSNTDAKRMEVERKNLADFPEHDRGRVEEVASRLLANSEWRGATSKDFDAAAESALKLLDACSIAIERRRKHRYSRDVGQTRNLEVPAWLSYREGITYITEQNRHDRAEACFTEFLPYWLSTMEEVRATQRAAKIAEYHARAKEEGFERRSLVDGRQVYRRLIAKRKKRA